MFDVLFNGTEYLIAPIGTIQGWHTVDCASTLFQEGMRRIGLTVGVLGALAGAYASVLLLSTIADQRKAQAEFDSLLDLQITHMLKFKVTRTGLGWSG